MLPSRPVIFISAVSKELRSTRDLVAKTLLAMGYEPKWQDIAPTETGDLRAVLRKWVDQSHAVLQIVGHRYGHAPKQADETFGPVSYTQYEALYARAKGKTVWYILLDDAHPTDPADPEPEELRLLQEAYRIQVKAHHGLYHSSGAALTTENIVLKLRDDLARLRRRGKQWAALLLALLLFSLGGIGWTLWKQKHAGEKLTVIDQRTEDAAVEDQHQSQAIQEIKEQGQKTYAALLALPAARSEAKQAAPGEDEAAQIARAYASLEKGLKLPAGTLSKELPAFSQKLLQRNDTSELDRARAFFAIKQYPDAEASALRAKDHALASTPISIPDALAALSLAGEAAASQTQYKRALDHYQAAASLTSESRDVLEWARIQCEIGRLLLQEGQYDIQDNLMRRVWQSCVASGHPKHPVTLSAHNLWALALCFKGKSAEAEREQRAVLAAQENVLGPEHPNTLASRNNIALALNDQGKHAEAELEYRTLLPIHERVLGPEHPDSLVIRHNLAAAMYYQDKYAESERESRTVLAIQERVLGFEHPHTLGSRSSLASALYSQGKFTEAERQQRVVQLIFERVLGPEHPETLLSCYNISQTLEKLGKKAEALDFARRALAGRKKVLDEDHPDTQKAERLVEKLERK